MKANQKVLYEHFLKLSKEDNGIKGKNAKQYAEAILESFPEFKAKTQEEPKKPVRKA